MKHLIVAPAWVGDMVMAHTLVQVLQTQDAAAQIHMLAPPATYALAYRMPGVDGAIEFPLAHGELNLGKRWRIGQGLKHEGFDCAYVLPNSFKSALTPWWARIPRRVGWRGEARFGLLNDRRTLDAARYPLMIERFMALGLPQGKELTAPYPEPQLLADADNVAALVRKHELPQGMPVLALAPGAEYGPAKQWPARHYASVAAAALAGGYSVWLLGSPNDATVCGEIETLLARSSVPAGALRNLAGRTTLLDAVDTLSLADAVVCNDSGLMHVACALGRRVVAVFGSTSPDFTPPLGAGATVVQHAVPCSPCFKRECPLGHMDCLEKLPPQQVLSALGINLAQAVS